MASPRFDVPVLDRARQFLDAERTRVVHATEMEALAGLPCDDPARQFKRRFGTSLYRYLLRRRLAFARQRMHLARPLVDVACAAGFADQAPCTQVFEAACGLPPGRYRALRTQPSRRGHAWAHVVSQGGEHHHNHMQPTDSSIRACLDPASGSG